MHNNKIYYLILSYEIIEEIMDQKKYGNRIYCTHFQYNIFT